MLIPVEKSDYAKHQWESGFATGIVLSWLGFSIGIIIYVLT